MKWSTLLAPFCLAAALAAAGCGGGSMSLDPVAAAATKTQQASTFRTDYTATMTVKGQQISFSGGGMTDASNNAADLTFDFSGLPAALTKNGTHGEVIMTGQTLYMKMDFLQGQLPNGKQWMKLDIAKATGSASGNLPVGQVDPQQWLQELLASGPSQKLGTDTVQGEQMTHYHVTVDVTKTAHLTDAQRAKVAAAFKQAGLTTLPVDVWVDGQGLVRREKLDFALGKAAGGLNMHMTADFSDFGAPATIAAPPSEQVFDATQIAAARQGQTPKAATSEWARRATPVCRKIVARATAALPAKAPATLQGRLAVAKLVEPLERQELNALAAIRAPRTAAIDRALAALRADLHTVQTAIRSAGDGATFTRLYTAWVRDQTAPKAFGAAGVPACAG